MNVGSISVHRISGDGPVSFRRHARCAEIVLVEGGEARCRGQETVIRVENCDVLVLMGAVDHAFEEPRGFRAVGVLFDSTVLAEEVADMAGLPGFTSLFNPDIAFGRRTPSFRRVPAGYRALSYLLSIAGRIEGLLCGSRPGSSFLARLSLLEMISVLCRSSVTRPHVPNDSMSLVHDAVRYIEQRFRERIALDDLTRVVNLSRAQLSRHFKLALGCSTIEYVIRKRITHACELLRTTQQSITEIALETGFSDGNYLTRQFSRVMHMPPTVYREQ